MRNNIPAGGKNNSTYIIVLSSGARGFYFRNIAGKHPPGNRNNPQQDNHCDSNDDETLCPWRTIAFAGVAGAAVDTQALKVFVFCINRHTSLLTRSKYLCAMLAML